MAKWGKGNLYWRRDQFFASMTAYQARANNQFMIADIDEAPIEVTHSIQPQMVRSAQVSNHAFSIIGRATPPDEVYGIRIITYPDQVVYKKVTSSVFFKFNAPPLTDEVHGIKIDAITHKVIYKRTANEAFSPRFNRLQFDAAVFPQINIHQIGERLVRRVVSNGAFVTAARFVVADLADEALPEGVTLVPHIVYQTPRGIVQSYLIITRLASLEVIFPINFSDTEDSIVLTTQDADADSLTTSEDGIVIVTKVP